VYIYSRKEDINDGFLAPFKVKRIKTTIDDYIYTSEEFLQNMFGKLPDFFKSEIDQR
jgi:hypothetical protein